MIVNKVVNRKVVDKKPPNPIRVLKKKTNALCIRLYLRGVDLKGKVGAQKIEILIDKGFNK